MAEPRDIRERVEDDPATDYARGRVVWDPVKSLWWGGHAGVALIFGPMLASLDAVAVWLLLSVVTLCGGHSLGMHRKLIHNSFGCPRWLERFGIWLACLVGLGGPMTMMRAHDLRDWAQRGEACHPFFSQHDTVLRDTWRQLHCRFELEVPPRFHFPDSLMRDPVMVWLQRTSMLQNGLLAVALFAPGGWAWVVWGVCVRVTISMLGHSLVGWFAHNWGHQGFTKPGAAVQGHDVPGMSLLTFGESYHSNHHAFPESANFALLTGQWDAGFWVLRQLKQVGLVWDLCGPEVRDGEVAPVATAHSPLAPRPVPALPRRRRW